LPSCRCCSCFPPHRPPSRPAPLVGSAVLSCPSPPAPVTRIENGERSASWKRQLKRHGTEVMGVVRGTVFRHVGVKSEPTFATGRLHKATFSKYTKLKYVNREQNRRRLLIGLRLWDTSLLFRKPRFGRKG